MKLIHWRVGFGYKKFIERIGSCSLVAFFVSPFRVTSCWLPKPKSNQIMSELNWNPFLWSCPIKCQKTIHFIPIIKCECHFTSSRNVNFKMQNALRTICQQFPFQCDRMNNSFVCFQKSRINYTKINATWLLSAAVAAYCVQSSTVEMNVKESGNLSFWTLHIMTLGNELCLSCTVAHDKAVRNDFILQLSYGNASWGKSVLAHLVHGHEAEQRPFLYKQSTNLLWNIK